VPENAEKRRIPFVTAVVLYKKCVCRGAWFWGAAASQLPRLRFLRMSSPMKRRGVNSPVSREAIAAEYWGS